MACCQCIIVWTSACLKKTCLTLIAVLGSILAQCTSEVWLTILSVFTFCGMILLLYNRHGLLWKHLKVRPYKLLQRPEGKTFSPPNISECTCWLVKCNALACSGAGPADTTCESGTSHLDKTTVSRRIYFFPLRKESRNCNHKRVYKCVYNLEPQNGCSAVVLSWIRDSRFLEAFCPKVPTANAIFLNPPH